jgi:hypothetical protein
MAETWRVGAKPDQSETGPLAACWSDKQPIALERKRAFPDGRSGL